MSQEKYKEDLREIRDIMDRSSRFLSLSGLSGIAAGSIALIGAFLAYRWIYSGTAEHSYAQLDIHGATRGKLLLLAGITLVLAIGSVIFFTTRETRQKGQKIWDRQTQRLLGSLSIPLFSGGIICLILLFQGLAGLVAPLTLVFYGLALVNAGKYTIREIHSLGLLEIGLGLAACYFTGYGLLFWAFGFGLLHIAYGVFVHYKYQS